MSRLGITEREQKVSLCVEAAGAGLPKVLKKKKQTEKQTTKTKSAYRSQGGATGQHRRLSVRPRGPDRRIAPVQEEDEED